MSKKQHAKAQRRRARQQERRTRIHRAQQRLSQRQFWHGGLPGLGPGDVLLSRADIEASGFSLPHHQVQPGYALGITDPGRVYFTTNREFARGWAAQQAVRDPDTGISISQGALYRVRPMGSIEPDPDFAHTSVSWCAPRACILEVEESSVSLDLYAATERIGPHIPWQDGSPVYAEDGSYLLAPEQIKDGAPAYQVLGLLRPWTPLECINAWLEGKPPPDRPKQSEHPGILHAGASAIDVQIVYERCAQRLSAIGTTYSRTVDGKGHPTVTVMLPKAGLFAKQVSATAGLWLFSPEVTVISHLDVLPQQGDLSATCLLLAMEAYSAPLTIGHCPPEVSRFFAALGFTVLRPGVRIPDLPGINLPASSQQNECWFYRQGPI